MFQRILVAINGSTVSDQALRLAIELAKEQKAHLRIIHVVDLALIYEAEASGIQTGDAERTLLQLGWSELAKAESLAKQVGVVAETVLLPVYWTGISDEIVGDARRWRADLIVLGTHGRRGIGRLLLGSVAEGVTRAASVPVLLIPRARACGSPRRVFDGRETGRPRAEGRDLSDSPENDLLPPPGHLRRP